MYARGSAAAFTASIDPLKPSRARANTSLKRAACGASDEPGIRFPRAILPEILPETKSRKNMMQQQVSRILHGQMAELAKRKPFNQRVRGSKPTRATDRPRRPKPETRTPNAARRTPTRLPDCLPRTFAAQGYESNYTGSALVIDDADLAGLEEVAGLVELAITLEGKGGFDFEPEHRNKDFYTTLESYMTAAVKGLPIVEHTMSSITVHGTTDYIVHYPIILVAPATRDAILGPKPYITHDIQYSVFRTGAKGCDKVTRHCKVSICASTNIWEVRLWQSAAMLRLWPAPAMRMTTASTMRSVMRDGGDGRQGNGRCGSDEEGHTAQRLKQTRRNRAT